MRYLVLFLFLPFCIIKSKELEQETGTVENIDGNIYKTVTIGNLWWMAENLKVIHYQNGDPVENIASSSKWVNLASGAHSNYNNDSIYVSTYGDIND